LLSLRSFISQGPSNFRVIKHIMRMPHIVVYLPLHPRADHDQTLLWDHHHVLAMKTAAVVHRHAVHGGQPPVQAIACIGFTFVHQICRYDGLAPVVHGDDAMAVPLTAVQPQLTDATEVTSGCIQAAESLEIAVLAVLAPVRGMLCTQGL